MDGKLFNLDWQKYLALLFLLLGAGFFSSGVVSWVAANWDYFSKFQKLYATQFWLSASLVSALVFYLRESKRLAGEGVKTVSAIFFFITAVFVGALFALIGQIYQTGGNTWKLFALWSALQIPLLLLLPNIANALLLGVTLNITLMLFSGTYNLDSSAYYLLLSLNLIFVFGAERFSKTLHDEAWRVLPKIANVAVAYILFFCLVDNFRDERLPQFLWLMSFGFLFYYKSRSDIFPVIVHFVALLVNFNVFLLKDGDIGTGHLFLAIMVTLPTIIFGALQLKKHFFNRYPNLAQGWAVQVMFSVLSLLMTGLIVGFVYLLFGKSSDESLLLITAVIIFAVALFLHYGKIQEYLVDILMAVSGVLFFAYFMLSNESKIGFGPAILATSAYSIVIYYFKRTLWLRSLAVMLFLVALSVHFYLPPYLYDKQDVAVSLLKQLLSMSMPYWFMTGSVVLFYIKGKESYENNSVHITPIAWALLLTAIGVYFSQRAFFLGMIGVFSEGATLPEINSFYALFHVLTGNVFVGLKAGWWLYHAMYFIVGLLPLGVFLALSRRFNEKPANLLLIALILFLFCVAFISSNLIAFCLALLLVAYINSSRILFGLSVLGLLGALSAYYYMLKVPLLYKSFLLLGFGLIFAATAVFVYKQNKSAETEQSAVKNSPVLWQKPAIALAVLSVILGLANYSIVKYEDVLNNGSSIVLKLAPVDPRSLMQGDYMVLNYEILTELRNQLADDRAEQSTRRAYALIQEDEKGVAKLCRIERIEPTAFDGCRADVYLPVNTSSWQPRLPSQDYFFAEGKGAYYAQAEYGEYRFKDGTALLFRLLDKDLKPL